VDVTSSDQLSAEMDKVTPGDVANIEANGQVYPVQTTAHPTDEESAKGYIGINLQSKREPKMAGTEWLVATINWLGYFMSWLFILSLGIGLANLLPLGPVDGGRMFQLASRQMAGNAKRGDWWWKRVSLLVLAVIIVLVFAPVLKAMI
jgi:membrane-associated protease RseP (regulator of RpoE activity)